MMFSMGNCVKTNNKDVVNSSQKQPRGGGAGVRDSSFTRQSRDRDDSREREREARAKEQEREQRKKKEDAKKSA